MRKELIVHFTFLVAYFLIVSVYKTLVSPLGIGDINWFSPEYIIFWIGGVVGTLLVYVDHFVYALFLRPKEDSSVQARQMLEKSEIRKATSYLVSSHMASDKLVFHNAQFQSLFLTLALFIVTSSNSLLGTGIVLGFLLHLLVDMAHDLTQTGYFDRWFKQFPLQLTHQQERLYFVFQIFALLALGLFF